MFKRIVDEAVDHLATKFVAGEFYIGLEAIKKYVLFWMIADYLQSQQTKEKISILKYSDEKFVPRSYSGEDGNSNFDVEKIKQSFYERTLDHYNSVNITHKMELYMRQREESVHKDLKRMKGESEQGNADRFRGNHLLSFQIDEFAILEFIREGEYENVKANLTYKRLVSDKGYFNLITFKDYKKFVGVLKDAIDGVEDEYKNVRYYKLEKRLGFEASKSVLKAMNEAGQNGNPTGIACLDLIAVLKLPFLSERQKYAQLYPKLSESEKMIWRMEVREIMKFTTLCCAYLKREVNREEVIQELDLLYFKSSYLPETFQNTFSIRNDFSAKDFTLLMKTLDEYNLRQIDKFMGTSKKNQ